MVHICPRIIAALLQLYSGESYCRGVAVLSGATIHTGVHGVHSA